MVPRKHQLLPTTKTRGGSAQSKRVMGAFWTQVFQNHRAKRMQHKRHPRKGFVSQRDLLLRMARGRYTLHMQPIKAGQLRIMLSLAPLATWAADALKKDGNKLFSVHKTIVG